MFRMNILTLYGQILGKIEAQIVSDDDNDTASSAYLPQIAYF